MDFSPRASVDRKSPPTERVVQILNLLADTPSERLTLTRIAAALGLNKPTCLGILSALTEAEFVTRDDAKSYGLGPALLRLGSAAESGLANLDLVRPFLADLHDRLGVSCILTAVHGGQIVILDRLGPAIPGDRRDLVGERFPLSPPLGLVNVAWEHDSIVDAWLERPPLAPLPASEDAVRAVIASGRRHGYIVECLSASTTSSVVLASLLVSGMPRRVIDELRRHLPPVDWSEFVATMPVDRAATLPVANISAPIFDRHGAQQYTLTLVPERADATVAQCRDWAAAVVRAARDASSALRGG
ncbi:IclR family transcriptional regulator [Rhodococcus sp. NPDC127528]|uniref:IclR family transcriptional regulator n=1 Tax=unclassified Rhodococcus (in: high G+C Gram-positive bacteria) TaxID=192944 RepID=UPI0036389367